jgi:hypothetical protein
MGDESLLVDAQQSVQLGAEAIYAHIMLRMMSSVMGCRRPWMTTLFGKNVQRPEFRAARRSVALQFSPTPSKKSLVHHGWHHITYLQRASGNTKDISRMHKSG